MPARYLGLHLLAAMALTACEPAPVASGLHEAQIYAFGTVISLSTWNADPAVVEQAVEQLTADFAYMHTAWHAWNPGALGRTNQMLPSGQAFVASPAILPLIEKATALSLSSDELFNPAIGKLVALWGFHADLPGGELPAPEAITELLNARPSMRDLKIDGIMLQCSNPAVRLDFGAFAKGYGLDMAVTALQKLGIAHAILNAGGDLRAWGRRGERPWRIGIRHPQRPGAIASIEIAGDESVYTSGGYERNYEIGERRVHHIIDPRTGQPATRSLAATVIHRDGATADAAATALFIAGPADWQRIAAQMGVSEALLIAPDGTVHMTPAMADRVQFEMDPPPPVIISGSR